MRTGAAYAAVRAGGLRRLALVGAAAAGMLLQGVASPARAQICAFVTHEADGIVSVLDVQSKAVTADVEVGGRVTGVAIKPDGSLVYVADTDPDAALAMGTDVAAVTKTIALPVCDQPLCGPEAIAFAANGGLAYTPSPNAQGAQILSVIDTATNAVTNSMTIRPGAVPRGGGVALTSDGRLACLSGYLLQSVSGDTQAHALLYSDVLDTGRKTIVPKTTDLGRVTDMSAFLARAQTFVTAIPSGVCYVTDGFTGLVVVIDAAGNSLRKQIPLSSSLTGVSATPDGRFVYVTGGTRGAQASADEGQVFVIDTTTETVTATVRLRGRYLTGVAFTPDGTLALMTDDDGDRVLVMDTSTKTVTATIAAGSSTRSIAIAALPGGCPGAPPACAGDCDGTGQVTVDELLTMVNIALGNSPVSQCHAADPNQDGQVTVDEILNAVIAALDGCPAAG